MLALVVLVAGISGGSSIQAAQVEPTPCAFASPAAISTGLKPAPCPSAIPKLKEIGQVKSRGRIDNLIGSAGSASEGYVGHSELEQRPILRPGELLETVPGVVISQHSGEGKANQYYLRGFNLDHGTDIAITIGGVPA
ncbi:MAG: TonB-dependent receptor plug domain-containing protein, partial [Candidatus Eremiobacteraeota bacterium]|nr:TonB-dependent receptor plug domain-containing protein [Candidatus Eremiobacteraeota bacterium]